jgi:methionyl-tRNA synthetase
VPEPGELDELDQALLAQAEAAFESVGRRLAAVQLRAALAEALALAREANRYLDVKAPWFQIKTDRAAAATSLYVVLRVIDSLKVLLAPFLPFSAERLHRTLGYTTSLFGELVAEEVNEGERSYPVLHYQAGTAMGRWEASRLPAGQALQKPEPLFTKLEESVAAEEQARLGA